MANEVVNTGTAPNSNSGDSLRAAMTLINQKFSAIEAGLSDDGAAVVAEVEAARDATLAAAAAAEAALAGSVPVVSSIAAGVSAVAVGGRFRVPQSGGLYHNEYARLGTEAEFIGPVAVNANAQLMEEDLSAYTFPRVDFHWRTRAARKWDGRAIPNHFASVMPTYNLIASALLFKDEGGDTNPVRTPFPATAGLHDPLGHQTAVQLDFGANSHHIALGQNADHDQLIDPVNLKLRMWVKLATGTGDVSFGASTNTAGKYADQTVTASWASVSVAVASYSAADTFNLVIRPTTAFPGGAFSALAFCAQVYDDKGATYLPSAVQERAADFAGHAKAPFAYAASIQVDAYGWAVPNTYFSNAVVPLNRVATDQWFMGVWADFSYGSYPGSYAAAMSFLRQVDDSNMHQKGALGMDCNAARYGRVYVQPSYSDSTARLPDNLLNQGPTHLAVKASRVDGSNVKVTGYVNGVPAFESTEAIGTIKPEMISLGGYDATTTMRQDGNGRMIAPDRWADPVFHRGDVSDDDLAEMIEKGKETLAGTYRHDVLVIGCGDSLTAFAGSPFWAVSQAASLRPGVHFVMDAWGGTKYGTGPNGYNFDPRQALRRRMMKYGVRHYKRVILLWQYGTNDLISGVLDTPSWAAGRTTVDNMIAADVAWADPANTGKIVKTIVTIPAHGTLTPTRESYRLAYNADRRANYAAQGWHRLIDLASWVPPTFASQEACALAAVGSGNAYFQSDGIHWTVADGVTYMVSGGSYPATDLYLPFLAAELDAVS